MIRQPSGEGRRRSIASILGGLIISGVLLALVLSRVDLGEVLAALAGAGPLPLLGALAVVFVDLLIRAARWRVLLAAILPDSPSTVRAAAYLAIGYLANALLPARMGDVARAYVAGAAFGGARMATLGTILVERISDGLAMLLLALAASALLVGGVALQDLRAEVLVLAGLVLAGFVVAGAAWLVLRRGPLARTRLGGLVRRFVERLAPGAKALSSARGVAAVVTLTGAAAGTACLVAGLVTGAVHLALSPQEVVLFTSGLALSLAIPAAPASVGTLEFAGVLVLTAVGADAEVALAAVLLVRLVTTLPLALAGVVAWWVMRLRSVDPGGPHVADPVTRETR